MNFKKFFPVLLAVILVSAVFVVPAFAQEPTPPVDGLVAAPVFDWAKISNALTDLLTAFLIPAAAFAARWMFAKGSVEYSKLTEAQKEGFRSFLRTAIYATEQMDLKGKIGNKMDYVVKLAETWLAQSRLEIGLTEIKLEVEAIVAREFNMGKILAPKTSEPRING
jgi:hypothetical protein